MKPKRQSTSTDRATRWAEEVLEGRWVVGPHVRAAVARHIDDLRNGAKRGLMWSVEEAAKAHRYFENVLHLNAGDFEGKPFVLLGWQAFVVGSLNGWRAADGYRRFRVAYVETAKGSGKSPLAAGIGLRGLTSDGEARAEVYAAATKRDQAMVLFRDAVAMVGQSPQLKKRIKKSGREPNVWSLDYLQTGSFFRPISADDGQSGPRPHISLIDEVHEHKTNTVIEMLRAGTKFRRQALIFMITNSGASNVGPCREYHDMGIKIAHRQLINDAFFAFICSLDTGDKKRGIKPDDPFKDESCWAKANPSLQEADLPGMKYIREQVDEARGLPSKEAVVRRLNFCQWTGAASPWLSPEVWQGAAKSFKPEDFHGRRAYAGLDLGSTLDLTGLVLLIEPEDEGEPWHILPYAWLPEDGIEERAKKDKVPYDAWARAGFMELTPGKAVSRLAVARRLSQLSEVFTIVKCGYDRWRIEDFLAMANEEGIILPEMVPFGQGYQSMAPAVERFEEMLVDERLVHPDNPVLNMCAENAVITSDDAGNRKPSKEKASGRIDLIVASIMAAGVAAPDEEGDIEQFFRAPIIVG